MKAFLAVLIGLFFGVVFANVGTSSPAFPIDAPRPTPRDRPPVGQIYPVAPNLYVVPGGGGNTAVFVTASGVLLVDTKYAGAFPDLMAQVRIVTDKPIAYAVNTHAHTDHTGGNRHLPPQTDVIAQAHTAQRLNDLRRTEPELRGVRTVRGYQDTLTLFSGDETVELHYFGAAHTDGDTVVVFRAAGVMHAGDLFPERMPPTINLEYGGNGIGFADVLPKVAALAGVHTVITGHGPVVTRDALVEFAAFYRLLFDHVSAAAPSGRDKTEAFKAFSLPSEFGDYRMGRAFNTMDEIDRSIRPRWLRRLPPAFSRYLLPALN